MLNKEIGSDEKYWVQTELEPSVTFNLNPLYPLPFSL